MAKSTLRLEQYTISQSTGFLPGVSASYRLPEYYNAWEDFCDSLSDHIEKRTVRQRVEDIPSLSTEYLLNEGEWRRAYSILSYLISAYIWTGDTPIEIVPEVLAKPYVDVCRHVEMPEVISYTGLILWNCRPINDDLGYSLDNLDVCRTFTGTQDERWFHMICAAIEAKAGKAISKLLLAITAADQGDTQTVKNTLQFVAETVRHLTALLQEMHHRVNPSIWFHKLRPFLAGSIDDRLPNGFSFDGGETYIRLAGANAGQSSLFQFFDIALGISHQSDFAARMRTYMPGPHAGFLKDVECVANLRGFVREHGELRGVYDECLRELEIFRDRHLRIVGRFIVIPARESASKAKDIAPRAERVELRGVGGAPLAPFLRGMRDETRDSALDASADGGEASSGKEGHVESYVGWAIGTVRTWLVMTVRYRSG